MAVWAVEWEEVWVAEEWAPILNKEATTKINDIGKGIQDNINKAGQTASEGIGKQSSDWSSKIAEDSKIDTSKDDEMLAKDRDNIIKPGSTDLSFPGVSAAEAETQKFAQLYSDTLKQEVNDMKSRFMSNQPPPQQMSSFPGQQLASGMSRNPLGMVQDTMAQTSSTPPMLSGGSGGMSSMSGRTHNARELSAYKAPSGLK